MFTGIVQALVPVVGLVDKPAMRELQLDLGDLVNELADGASVAVNGVCLTVVASSASRKPNNLPTGHACFDLIQETLDNSSLGRLEIGHQVNVERSYRVGDEVGGHIVSGHIAAAVPLVALEEAENLRNLFFEVPAAWFKYVHLKGFVALDGASLTISHLDEEQRRLGVSLIPETLERTTLGRIQLGDTVNLEVDSQTQTIVDTVERTLNARAASGS